MTSSYLSGVLTAWAIANVGLGLFFVLAYFVRRREIEYLIFGALCGAIAVTTLGLSMTYGESTLPKTVQAFGISGAVGHGLRRLFLTHPPLEERILALQNAPMEQVRGTVVS